MDNQFTTMATTEDYYVDTIDYSDYDNDLNSGMCNRSWVREFRGQYEPPLYSIIFILGAVGNLMVVCIYTTVKNRLKTMTDMYLLNLAVADLLFLCMLPFWAVDAIKGWHFGDIPCKIVSAVYKINFFSSMFLLTCSSVDRYIQVIEAQNLKNKMFFYSKLTCVCVWVVSTLLALPEFIFASVKTNQNQPPFCVLVYWNNENNLTKILVLSLQICMGFCLPLLIMFFCYFCYTLLRAKGFERHKALRVNFAVVFVFILSQLPHNGLLIMEAMQAANVTITACDTVKRFDIAGQIAKSLAYTHTSLIPFLYVFIGVHLRQDLLRMMQTCIGKGRLSTTQPVPKHPSNSQSDTELTPALSQ